MEENKVVKENKVKEVSIAEHKRNSEVYQLAKKVMKHYFTGHQLDCRCGNTITNMDFRKARVFLQDDEEKAFILSSCKYCGKPYWAIADGEGNVEVTRNVEFQEVTVVAGRDEASA